MVKASPMTMPTGSPATVRICASPAAMKGFRSASGVVWSSPVSRVTAIGLVSTPSRLGRARVMRPPFESRSIAAMVPESSTPPCGTRTKPGSSAVRHFRPGKPPCRRQGHQRASGCGEPDPERRFMGQREIAKDRSPHGNRQKPQESVLFSPHPGGKPGAHRHPVFLLRFTNIAAPAGKEGD